MVSITVKATITITIPNKMKCQSRSAIDLIPAIQSVKREFAVR